MHDRAFRKKTILARNTATIPVENSTERKKFAIAAFNAGEGRIAKAQELANKNGKNPAKWDDVKEYLISAGATPKESIEAQEYVDKVLKYDAEFAEKSEADKAVKLGNPRKIKKLPAGGHWITLDGQHIFIEDK